MSDVDSRIRSQLRDAFVDAEYPVEGQMDLVPALPNGPGTTFEADDVSFTALELASRLSDYQEFPYEDVESLVDDVITGAKSEGLL